MLIRRQYSPLSVAVSLKLSAPASQSFDSEKGFLPDRESVPLVISPVVMASAVDGSWPEGVANAKIANVRWAVNGADIASLPDWASKYSIVQDNTADKGRISISKNLPSGQIAELVFSADLVDSRSGSLIHIESDKVLLSTSAVAESSYSLHVDGDSVISYDPVADQPIHDIPLVLSRGAAVVESDPDISYDIFAVADDGALSRLASGFDEIPSAGAVGVNPVIDLRLSPGRCYMVKAMRRMKDGARAEIARAQFQVARKSLRFEISDSNLASVADGDTVRVHPLSVKCNGRVVAQPDRFIAVDWKTKIPSAPEVRHNSGSVGVIDLVKAGMAAPDGSPLANEIEIWHEFRQRGPHAFLTLNGVPLAVNGSPIIIPS